MAAEVPPEKRSLADYVGGACLRPRRVLLRS
jgi:hypothetical protein